MSNLEALFPRRSGVLLHITSLPSPYGIGDLGEVAYQFVDALSAAGQAYWQVLPLGPTGYGDSPYQCFSSFAGNVNLISLDELVKKGWLSAEDLADKPAFPTDHVDYEAVNRWHLAKLQQAYRGYLAGKADRDFKKFCDEHAYWLDDFAMFMLLKEQHNLQSWTTWEKNLTRSKSKAVGAIRRNQKEAVQEQKFRQWVFDRQWGALKAYANSKGIQLIGDVPIYAAHDSADVWANPKLFEIDARGRVVLQAGVPPDYFSKNGQLWGNPIYKWAAHQETGYEWWVKRIERTLQMVDLVRIDHFRGFYNYWEVGRGKKTAKSGRWVDGPRDAFFNVLRERLQADMGKDLQASIIAEDLGDAMDAVIQWRQKLGLLGMKIMQFAFGDNLEEQRFTPIKAETGRKDDCVMYTGTHDNNPAIAWWEVEARRQQRATFTAFTRQWYGKTTRKVVAPHKDMIEMGMGCHSPLFIAPLQDILGLDASSRMNTPGKDSGNWGWRATPEQFAAIDWTWVADLTRANGRAKE